MLHPGACAFASALMLLSGRVLNRTSSQQNDGAAARPLTVIWRCWQGVMLDIVSMLFTLLRAYVPAEFRWSYLMDLYDMFAWNITMCTILYCVFFALACAPSPLCPGFSGLGIENQSSLFLPHGPLPRGCL